MSVKYQPVKGSVYTAAEVVAMFARYYGMNPDDLLNPEYYEGDGVTVLREWCVIEAVPKRYRVVVEFDAIDRDATPSELASQIHDAFEDVAARRVEVSGPEEVR